jgi:4a-hydroxytetrahydrobiopterin dehydratase
MLADERCGVCNKKTPALGEDEAQALLAELDPGWAIVDGRLRRTWRFPDFAAALARANAIGAVAEAEGHHPDLRVGWGRLAVELRTHAIGALSRADFVLAAKVDRLG